MLIINDKASYKENASLIREFEQELYIPSFPNEDEREPFVNIENRIINDEYPKTAIQLIVENGTVIAGCVSDYYPECKSVEPIYLVVRESFRKKGFGKALLDNLNLIYPDSRHMFLETDNPEKVSAENSAIDPRTRIKIYRKLGFKKVHINYVQPPLSEDKDYERGLLLMHRGFELDKESLKIFLTCFYKGLGYENSPELKKMIDKL